MPEDANGATLITLLWVAYIYWHVLSRGHQFLPPDRRDPEGKSKPDPDANRREALDANSTGALPDAAPAGGEIADDTLTTADALAEIERRDPSFEPSGFLQGAANAYEMIVAAFAAGDRVTLKKSASENAYRDFVDYMSERERRGERAEVTFVHVAPPEIVHARVRGDRAEISVRFTADLISVTRNAIGAVTEGDPKRIIRTADTWAFAKSVLSGGPDWTMTASNAD